VPPVAFVMACIEVGTEAERVDVRRCEPRRHKARAAPGALDMLTSSSFWPFTLPLTFNVVMRSSGVRATSVGALARTPRTKDFARPEGKMSFSFEIDAVNCLYQRKC
jgi:hypothetical protein